MGGSGLRSPPSNKNLLRYYSVGHVGLVYQHVANSADCAVTDMQLCQHVINIRETMPM